MVTGLYRFLANILFDGSGVNADRLGQNQVITGITLAKSGAMLRNTITPDGYYIDQEGIWRDYKYPTTTELITIDKAEAVPETTVQTTTEVQVQQMEQILQK